MNRQDAAEATLLEPESRPIGRFAARRFSGGDMLVATRLGLGLASGDGARVMAMTTAEKTEELLTIGALLCYDARQIRAALFQAPERVREDFVAPVLFALSPDETAQLIEWVAGFFSRAQQVAVAIEPKPLPGDADAPQPAGK